MATRTPRRLARLAVALTLAAATASVLLAREPAAATAPAGTGAIRGTVTLPVGGAPGRRPSVSRPGKVSP